MRAINFFSVFRGEDIVVNSNGAEQPDVEIRIELSSMLFYFFYVINNAM